MDWNFDISEAPEGTWIQGFFEGDPWASVWTVRFETGWAHDGGDTGWYGNHHTSPTATPMSQPKAWRYLDPPSAPSTSYPTLCF